MECSYLTTLKKIENILNFVLKYKMPLYKIIGTAEELEQLKIQLGNKKNIKIVTDEEEIKTYKNEAITVTKDDILTQTSESPVNQIFDNIFQPMIIGVREAQENDKKLPGQFKNDKKLRAEIKAKENQIDTHDSSKIKARLQKKLKKKSIQI